MNISNLKKEINGKNILKNINFSLGNNDKVILIGKNGVGKSTLLKILGGFLNYDFGSINYNNEKVSLLKQEISPSDYDKTIISYVKEQTGILKLENELHNLENNLTDNNMEEYGDKLNDFLKLDGYNFNNNLENTLLGLNFNKSLDTKVGKLSGGEKIKVLLSVVLLADADILLFDEPTNNLDIEAIQFLENKLISSKKKMIIVSHDETFISNIGNKIFELSDGQIKEYNMKYNDYLIYKENEYQQEYQAHQKRLEEKEKLKVALEKAKSWENKGLNKKTNDNDKIVKGYQKERTKNTSGKISKIKAELESVSVDDGFRKKESINFIVDTSIEKSPMYINLDNLICGYDDFRTPPLSINIPFGSRLLVSGSNGTGKTTLLKTIIGQNKPISGFITIGNGVKIGYISQDSFDSTNSQETVEKYILKKLDVDKSLLFTVLDKFNISYEDKDKIYSHMSPGERTRINLAKLALEKINVLILDEATNHLDVEAVNILEEVINSFNGTIICVSHNRKFIEKLNPDLILDVKTGIIEENKDIKKR